MAPKPDWLAEFAPLAAKAPLDPRHAAVKAAAKMIRLMGLSVRQARDIVRPRVTLKMLAAAP